MATEAQGPVSVSGDAFPERGPAAERWASTRRRSLDNLKVILVAAVIAGHAVLGYTALDWWSYADVREVTLSPAVAIGLLVLAGPVAVLVIPLLFLVAGLLSPPSLARKGTGAYVRGRLLRLGVPYAVFGLLLWPLLEYALFRGFGQVPGLWAYLAAEGTLDTGVLWFIGALLVFSLAYAAWHRARPDRGRRVEIGLGHLLALTVVVTLVAFLVRLAVPLETDTRYVDLQLPAWPAGAALFGLGVAASPEGWLAAVPDRLRRGSRRATLAAVGVIVLLVALAAAPGVDTAQVSGQVWGGWSWPALAFAAVESALSVFGSVWLLGAAQRRLDRRLPGGPVLARSAYGAFLLQGLVLFGLALALRAVPLPAEVKALVVAAGGVAGSFALAGLLVARVPGVARIL